MTAQAVAILVASLLLLAVPCVWIRRRPLRDLSEEEARDANQW